MRILQCISGEKSLCCNRKNGTAVQTKKKSTRVFNFEYVVM